MRAILALIIVLALVLTACGSSSQSMPSLPAPTELNKLESNSGFTAQEQKYVEEVQAILENYASAAEDGGDLLGEAGQDNSLVFDQDWKNKMVISLALIQANSTLARELTPPARFKAAHQHLLAMATQMDEMATLVAEGVDGLDSDKFDQAGETLKGAGESRDKLVSAILAAVGTGAQPSSASTAKAKQNANLRSGPGKDYALAGSVTAGQALKIVAKNKAGDWYQLSDGKWIAGFLVTGVPAGLPVAGATTVAPTKAAVATARPAAKASGATANKNANLRKGPGTNYDVGGSTKAGQALEIVGKNEAGDWYQLSSGLWIANFLVNNAPVGMPIVESSVPQPQAPQATAAPAGAPAARPVRVGTHIVGKDIQPGIYRGLAGQGLLDSCYWARLSDLKGELGSLIANENAVGQYYLEVKPTDVALETACPLTPLAQAPVMSVGDKLPAGTYLVGRDIKPGTYQGEAGTDILESCYWARLSNVAGGMESLIANDNANGPYFVQVAGSDFALNTACPLVRIGD